MRIAYITADRGIPVFGTKGASVHVREMVNALGGLGQNVTIFAAARGSNPAPIAADIVGIGDAGLRLSADVPSPKGADRVSDKECRALAVGDALQDRLEQCHREIPFDLIYERYSLFSAAGVRAAEKLGIPCFVEVNSPLLLEQQKYRQLASATAAEAVEAEVFRSADAVFAVSQEVRSYVISKGTSPARAHVVPNGVDTARFHPGVEAEILDGMSGKFVVGFSGSLKPWHGIEVLLDAFGSLAERSDDYHLLIVGEGPLRDTIEQFAGDNGLRERITITGWMPHDALPGLIKSMDVAVAPYPKLDDFYFSPLKLYEYMAVGVPIVASRLGQITEALEHNTTALLAEPGDADELAACIDRLHQDRALGLSLGSAAAETALNYTWEGNAQRILELAGKQEFETERREEVA